MIAPLLMLLASVAQAGPDSDIVMQKAPPPEGISRCLRSLPAGSRLMVRMTCRVNSVSGPSRCTFEPDNLSRGERYAAMCASRGYRFRLSDGRPATGRMVSYTLNLITHRDHEPALDD